MTTAVVVGSGPNGLAAAIRLSQAGVAVTVLEAADRPGGGTRTTELTEPGLLHDECSFAHPMGVASPFLASLGLTDHGLDWAWPEVDLAHPLDDGPAGVLSRDMDRTLDSLDTVDRPRWRRTFGHLATGFDDLVEDLFRPVVGRPRHPLTLARFGTSAFQSATRLARRFDGDAARALYGGSAAHVFGRLDGPMSGAVGLLLTAAGHAVGWPVARGGSQAITTAMVGVLESHGGTVRTSTPVSSLGEVDELVGARPDVVLLDTNPTDALRIAGDAVAPRIRRALQRYRYGPAVHKVDYAIRGEVPWTNPECARAGTVHVGGSWEEIVAAEAATARGEMPERPFLLVGQQYVADPSRSVGDLHPFYAYAHVPHGYDGDATEAVTAQVERFAPGFRDLIVSTHSRTAMQMAAYNPNYRGGDIGAGANGFPQLLLRPRPALHPYRLAERRLYLASSATPPGPGVHGMCGFHAAQAALADL
ncbi:NAD(P)/FAD-dependent oxidoreductase [Nocardioides panacisoli]|uniref:phytoene desaturase family protein n=1 Tax=Nocardioides panacisoli TaxID=627624 RepID=UPI001C63A32F|nr:NAD(P)/FAD-dependent oxidoreductase [Nocardioides panacisoli]QYJ05126.1 NAD(P)/FAD-dependent oxidoreductase [Nocardioides panacisoli]